ncbi:hypothetical protein LNTAR_24636 [Lentisphaera araneosa HTCC2155]|uniref:Uncharacterized protein n=1 Tax=Lentisphaera araneosa HTCC2155 TaxID=313628 RepID=A6DT98_9BACT|nr:hypothetical protein [Lentisphaera araneosa]EDM25171.1 hypothetical protein LNTAR_24636 [Lentisphaera araneosa HTCC2155]
MKVISYNKFFLLFLAVYTPLFARSTEDYQALLRKTIEIYPEFEEVLPSSSLNNSINSFVPTITNKQALGISAIPLSPLDNKDITRLKEMMIYNTTRLLEPNSLPIIFEMLTNAIASDDSMQIGFWTACLNNNIANYSNLSNLAEINYLSEYIPALAPDLKNSEGQAISMRGAATPSFNDAFKTDYSQDIYEKLISNIKPQVITTNSEYITNFLLQRPASILKNSQMHANKLALNLQRAALTKDKTTYNGNLAVLKSSVGSIQTTASILRTAVEFAKLKIKYKAPDSKSITVSSSKIDQAIPLETSLFLKEAIKTQSKEGSVGLLVEPLSTKQGSLLGKQALVLSSQISSSLAKRKIEYTVLNLDSILRSDFPTAKSMPVIIIPCIKFSARSGWYLQSELNKRIREYQNQGGRIMWVSSHSVNFLGEISRNLQNATNDLNISLDGDDEIHIHKILNASEEDGSIDMLRSPAQFNKMLPLGYTVRENENITPLISINSDGELITIAAVNKDKSSAYFNPIILYPAAVDVQVDALIPAKFESSIEDAFMSSLRILMDPNSL